MYMHTAEGMHQSEGKALLPCDMHASPMEYPCNMHGGTTLLDRTHANNI